MRTALQAVSARLIVGHLDREAGEGLVAVVEGRGKPAIFCLADPEGLAINMPVPAGARGIETVSEPARWGKLVLETVGNETLGSAYADVGEALVDALNVAHRRLGVHGLELIPRGSSGVGFAAVAIVDQLAQIVVVPPARLFVVHQGVALSVPEGSDAGRGIWVRDDLRAEIFAGIGGSHEPDVHVYEANVSPGDTLVLASSDLARMLTEDDVRLAVTYEEAGVAAERLKQLALQRGVEAGVAQVIEIAGSLDSEPRRADEGTARPAIHVDMPPIGSIFSTARDRLLEAIDRAQAPVSRRRAEDEDEDEDIPWPARPRLGQRRPYLPASTPRLEPSPTYEAMEAAAFPDEPTAMGSTGSSRAGDAGPASRRLAARAGLPARSASFAGVSGGGPRLTASGATAARAALGAAANGAAALGDRFRSALAGATRPRASAGNLRVGYRTPALTPLSSQDRMAAFGFGRRQGQAPRRQTEGGGLTAALTAALSGGFHNLNQRLSTAELGGKRKFLAPALGLLVALLLVLLGVRAVRGQQAQQLQQRYSSLITAATQLEAQARGSGDRNDAQSLIHRAQALVDQAASLNVPAAQASQVPALRKDLQADLDRLNSIVALPDPTVVVNLTAAAKDVNATSLIGSPAGLFALDVGGHRVLQVTPGQKTPSIIATKGDKSGGNQLGDPKLVTVMDGSPLILDSNRNLWRYSADQKGLQQIGLKSSDTWKDATSIAAYSPNVYVLDAAGGNIYRYASRDGQFTDAPTRFLAKDDTGMLGQATSLAIDGSIWALTSDGHILKLEGGNKQPFAITGLPQPIAKASQLYTDVDTKELYVLDGGSNRVIQIAKDGRYLREFNLSLPAPATAIWPDEPHQALYVLSANTVYRYQLPG